MLWLIEQIEELCEAKPSKNRSPIVNKPTNTSARASAEIFHATDVWLDVNLGLADLRALIQRKEVQIDARDRKRVSDQVNVYRLTLRYKGKGVPSV